LHAHSAGDQRRRRVQSAAAALLFALLVALFLVGTGPGTRVLLTGGRTGGLATLACGGARTPPATHGLKAAPVAARVAGATLTDIPSAFVGASGALRGPLHGGANADGMRLLLEFGKDAPLE